MKTINKTYFIILIASFVLSLLLSSCDNILETIPTDRISSEVFWKEEQDAEYATNAIYRFLDGTELFYYEGQTDVLHANIQHSDQALLERGEYDSNIAFIQSKWTNYYKGIHAVNSFLENIQQIDESEKINTYKDEVRTIRAFLYIDLVMLYGDVPLITESIDEIEESKKIARTNKDEVWNFIENELTETSEHLPVTATNKGRITKGAALSILTRAYLYQGKWAQAEETALKVINLNKYSLFDSYQNLFSYANENNSEVILDKEFIADSYSNNVFKTLAPFSIKSQGPRFVPTKKIVDAYDMTNGMSIDKEGSGFSLETQYENRDPRLYYSVFLPGDILPNGKVYEPIPGKGGEDEIASTYLATSLGFNIKKYINKEDINNTSNCGINIIIIRYAEILLSYAEARIEQNKLDQSTLDAINQVRQRPDVMMPKIKPGKNQDELRAIIHHERMIELAFEGQRLFDCRRWKTAEFEFKGIVEGLTYKEANNTWKTVSIGGFTKVFDPNKNYLYPIPQKEMDLNSNYTQNPGW